MSVFGLYSRYYDLLYQDKNYAAEASFVQEALARHDVGARTILELGCGTGRHASEMAQAGCHVHGVDFSRDMLEEAQRRFVELPDDVADRISFALGDIRSYRVPRVFDAVISLFHVFSYQVSNQDLRATFATALAHMKTGSLLAFDFWYGPAVLALRPETRVRRLENDRIKVLRITESTLLSRDNRVDVNFTTIIEDKVTGERQEIKELHPMRYLFLPEIDLLLGSAGFERLTACEWLTRSDLADNTWNGFVVARKVG